MRSVYQMVRNSFCWLLIEHRIALPTTVDNESKQLIYKIIRIEIKRKTSCCFVIKQSRLKRIINDSQQYAMNTI